MSDTSSSGTPVGDSSTAHHLNIKAVEKSAIENINIQELIKSASEQDSKNDTPKKIEIVFHHHHHYHKGSDTGKSAVRKSSGSRSSPSRSFTASPEALSNSNSINTSISSQNLGQRTGVTHKHFGPHKHQSHKHFNSSNNSTYVALRNLSLQNLNAAQHFLLAMGRDISFIVPILGLINSIKKAWDLNMNTLQKYPDIADMPNFYRTMFYIQQQDTKNLYLFWQNLFNNQIESYQNNTINLLQNWKHFISYLNLTDSTLINSTKSDSSISSSGGFSNSSSNFYNLTSNQFSSANVSNATVLNNISYTSSNSKSDIRPSYLSAIIRGRSSEFLMCGLWCIVSMYLTYVTLDALMVRWITIYSISAAILRMVSISLLIIIIELFILKTLSNEPIVSNSKSFKFGGENSLHAWIFISCVLTGIYIWQSFWTSFLQQQQKRSNNQVFEEEKKDTESRTQENGSIIKPFTTTLQFWKYTLKKHLDLYSIIVFAVVPVGFASFLTMIVLLRNLVIQRMDVEQLEKVWYEINKNFMA